MTQDKLLDKLRKLKAHADSAEKIGNSAEAEAFASMFQKLLLDHKLEMSDIEFEEMERTEKVEKHWVDYSKYGIKVKNQRILWMERLAGVIARAHFCRILVHPGRNYITLVGRKDDIAVAEYMYVTLVRLADRMSYLEYGKYNRECMRLYGNATKAHGFREAWLQAFILRLAERYEQAKQAAEAQCVALVRLDTAVDDFINTMRDGKPAKKAGALSTHTAFNREGSKRGTEAADNIDLRANALNQDGTRKKELKG
jgi:hypothetical protein